MYKRQVKDGLREGTHYEVIVDRREAIQHAIQHAKSGDIVLIAGKGHEDYQILKDKTCLLYTSMVKCLKWHALVQV